MPTFFSFFLFVILTLWLFNFRYQGNRPWGDFLRGMTKGSILYRGRNSPSGFAWAGVSNPFGFLGHNVKKKKKKNDCLEPHTKNQLTTADKMRVTI